MGLGPERQPQTTPDWMSSLFAMARSQHSTSSQSQICLAGPRHPRGLPFRLTRAAYPCGLPLRLTLAAYPCGLPSRLNEFVGGLITIPRRHGGYFGGGLATIVLAVLALEVHESITKLNALKQMISLCANVAAAVLFLFSSKVIWSAAIVMAVRALLGEFIGGFAATGLGLLCCAALSWYLRWQSPLYILFNRTAIRH